MGRKHLVAAVAYDGLCTFEFGCTVEVFSLERPELGVPWYDFVVCAEARGRLRAAVGVSLSVPHTLRVLERADTIVVPGWRAADQEPPAALTRALRKAYERGARVCSICSGVFVLAAAGILDGRRAATHWRYARQLAERYPKIEVLPNALYADEGRVITSAGSAAGLDMLLHLVRKDYGAKIANQVARRLVIPAHRQGGQAQFIERPVSQDERGRVAKLLDFIRAHPAERHTIEALAARAAMSPRTLHREFRAATGESAYAWVLRQRIKRARDLLEQDRIALPRVAQLAGLGSLESMRHHFRRLVGATPAAYRQRFRRSG